MVGARGAVVTDELDKVMIFRRNPRTLADGCRECGLSLVACDANADLNHCRCCESCSHPL